jgi:uncharacterized membrane protein (UPF0127 family)
MLRLFLGIIVVGSLGAGVGGLFFVGTEDYGQVIYGDKVISVMIADDPVEIAQGLSDTTLDTYRSDGMIFLFSESKERTFWMYHMNYDLDIVWIEGDEIVKIETSVSHELTDDEGVPRMHSSPYEVDKVLELSAGGVEKYGLEVGGVIVLNQ